MGTGLRITYDAEADASYIYLTDPIGSGEAVEQHVVDLPESGGTVVLDLDQERRLLGIELIGVTSLLRPESVPERQGQE